MKTFAITFTIIGLTLVAISLSVLLVQMVLSSLREKDWTSLALDIAIIGFMILGAGVFVYVISVTP